MNRIELRESIARNISMTFARSSGAGGQNVNKVNTKVHATIRIADLRGLTDAERILIAQRLQNSITGDGQLFIDVQDERSQEKNREIALERLERKIAQAAHIAKKRRKTKPTAASREKRLRIKKNRSQIKSLRNAKSLEH